MPSFFLRSRDRTVNKVSTFMVACKTNESQQQLSNKILISSNDKSYTDNKILEKVTGVH